MRPVPGDALKLDGNRIRTADLLALEAIIEEQRAIIDCLKAAVGLESRAAELAEVKAWMLPMNRQQRVITAALITASPKAVSLFELLDILPGRDHALDRDPQLVQVVISKVRALIGKRAILTLHGQGYYMPTAERDRLLSLA